MVDVTGLQVEPVLTGVCVAVAVTVPGVDVRVGEAPTIWVGVLVGPLGVLVRVGVAVGTFGVDVRVAVGTVTVPRMLCSRLAILMCPFVVGCRLSESKSPVVTQPVVST